MIFAPASLEAAAMASPSVDTHTSEIRLAANAALIGYWTIGCPPRGRTFLSMMDLDPARAVTIATFIGSVYSRPEEKPGLHEPRVWPTSYGVPMGGSNPIAARKSWR